MYGRGYSRILFEALSTNAGFFCRTNTTSNVVVCTTEEKERAECSARKPERAGIRDQKGSGSVRAYPVSTQNSGLLFHKSLLYRVPSQLRIGFHAHLFENPRTVGADRRDAKVRLVGDL